MRRIHDNGETPVIQPQDENMAVEYPAIRATNDSTGESAASSTDNPRTDTVRTPGPVTTSPNDKHVFQQVDLDDETQVVHQQHDLTDEDFLEATVPLDRYEESNEFEETIILPPEVIPEPDRVIPPVTELVASTPILPATADRQLDTNRESSTESSFEQLDNSVNRIELAASLTAANSPSCRRTRHRQKEYKTVGAWKRFIARTFDLLWQVTALLYGVRFVLGSSTLAAITARLNDVFSGVNWHIQWQLLMIPILLPLSLVLESFWIKLFGNTPGKALLGLRIFNKNSANISWWRYFRRNVMLWITGLGFGIPGVQLVSLGWQYSRLKNKHRASYDSVLGLWVGATPTGFMRKLVALLATVGVLMAIVPLALPASQFDSLAFNLKNTVNRLSTASGIGPIIAGIAEPTDTASLATMPEAENLTSTNPKSIDPIPENIEQQVGAGVSTVDSNLSEEITDTDIVSKIITRETNDTSETNDTGNESSTVLVADKTTEETPTNGELPEVTVENALPDVVLAELTADTVNQRPTTEPKIVDEPITDETADIAATVVISTPAMSRPWRNPVTELTIDVDARWTYQQTQGQRSELTFNWDGPEDISVNLNPMPGKSSSLNSAAQAYIKQNARTLDFANAGYQYGILGLEVQELTGRTLVGDSADVTSQVVLVNNQYWVLEMNFPGNDDASRLHAERLSSAIWATF